MSAMLPLMGSTNEQRDAYLRAQVEPGETILAVGPQALVTDRRILFGWRLNWPPRAGEWTHDALAFDEITRWREGPRHDGCPLLRLEHPSHRRLEWVPAHRFLWFRWGNATGEISHRETTFSFASSRDPVFRSMTGRLELAGATQGEPFVEMLPGTREERLGSSVAVFRVAPRGFRTLARLRGRLLTLDEHLHQGQIHWWIRVGSWLLLAVPAWFIRHWLVLPAVVVVEVAWVAGLWWSRHRDKIRQEARSRGGNHGRSV